MEGSNRMVSFIIPVFNEEESIMELYDRIQSMCNENQYHHYEVIFIDDGSTDQSAQLISQAIEDGDRHMKLIRFRRNFGKATALQAGFEHASGDVAITMDADLQDDPKEVPNMLAALDSGYDMVSGWKKNRHDPIEKRLPSKLFNFVTAKMSGIPLHDFNCGFKAYTKAVYKSLQVYGEMHRYMPVLAKRLGFSCAEVVVEHHARAHGHSKYGFERYLRGLFDSMTSSFLLRYGDRPMHFFGKLGLGMCFIGFVICLILTVQWIGGAAIGTRPLLLLGVLLIILGVQFFATGLSCEMMLDRMGVRSKSDTYIRQCVGFDTKDAPGASQR